MSTPPFRFRDIALYAYGPSVVNAIGHGAMMPVVALRARELGADPSTAALVVGMLGVGMLLASLPTGALIARIGERRALVLAGCIDALAMLGAALTGSVVGLGLAIALSGMTWSGFLMARQGMMIDLVPAAFRARAMALLGGGHRLGVLIGPLIGAALIELSGMDAVFVFASVLALTSAALAGLLRAPPGSRVERRTSGPQEPVLAVLWAHRTTWLTLGVAVAGIAAVRSMRNSLLPLWADAIHLDAATTSLLFAAAAAVDLAFVFPGGWLMDRHGRAIVAIPVVLSVAIAAWILPFTSTAWGLAGVTALIGAGNGLGSGIVMTLGADTAPPTGRAQFLGGWRLAGDIGLSAGPLALSAGVVLFGLPGACVALGALAFAGAGWTGFWTHRLDRRMAARS